MAFYFRLPVITDLTIEQQAVLNEPKPIAVSGGPGTGKSVVSLWRHIRNHATNRRSLLLTYTKSLEAYLKSSASSENRSAGESVARTYDWTTNNYSKIYNEIIIDEAQDVEFETYEFIKTLTSSVSYSADDNQMLYPSKGAKEQDLKSLFTSNSSYELFENFRNTVEIVKFVKSMFPLRLISSGKDSGQAPLVICTDTNQEIQCKVILDLIENFNSSTHNIAILVPLQSQVNFWYSELKKHGVACSKFVSSDGDFGTIENIHITTFKSSKGLEFDTVILPEFNRYQENISNLNVVNENDYYVVFTRTRRNLFLIDNSNCINQKCQLPFLQKQIESGIVKLDLSYIKPKIKNYQVSDTISRLTPEQLNKFLKDIEDLNI